MPKFIGRLLIIAAWIAIIAGIVYFPNFSILQSSNKTINVFAWGDILHPKVIQKFEKETGIKVNLNYYASNEELLVKLKATRGFGYDLVIPSDYAVKNLRNENLLKKLDKSQFNYWKDLFPFLRGHFFDPSNEYSIPYSWEVYGLAYNTDYFKDKTYENSWNLIYNPPFPYKVTVPDDPLYNIIMGAFYFYGTTDSLSPVQQEALTALLIKQKKWIEAYNEARVDYFIATGSCRIGVTSSSYAFRSKKQFPMIGFMIPQEGSFITIENFCIPVSSTKDKLVYKFINYLFSQESIQIHYDNYGFFPSSKKAMSHFSMDESEKEFLKQVEDNWKNFHFIRSILPPQELKDMWITIKTSDPIE